jgi:hypothetical protein
MYRPIHHLIAALVSLYRYFRPVRSNAPAYFVEEPPMFVHGNTKQGQRTSDAVVKYRRWRKVRMQMQRESRRRNRAA